MRIYVVFAILLFLLIPATTATTVTISPTRIEPGDRVTVDVKGLSDGATFSLSIGGEFDVSPGEMFAFTARDLILPFSLNSGEVSAHTLGTSWTGLSAKLGETTISLSNEADENGEYRTTLDYDIASGKYAFITLNGRAAPTTRNIIAKMTMEGIKKGRSDDTISFALDGIERGTAIVVVNINGKEGLSQKIVIEPASSGGNGSTGGPGGSTGSSGNPGSPAWPPGYFEPPTPADEKPSLTGADTRDIEIRALAVEGTLPAGWSMAGRTYAVTPADRALDAVLSFPAPNTTATIARLENGTWSPVPSKIEGDQITTTVSRGGSYAVLVPEGVPTQTAIPTTAPPAATTTPAATPLPALLPGVACAILILVQSRRT